MISKKDQEELDDAVATVYSQKGVEGLQTLLIPAHREPRLEPDTSISVPFACPKCDGEGLLLFVTDPPAVDPTGRVSRWSSPGTTSHLKTMAPGEKGTWEACPECRGVGRVRLSDRWLVPVTTPKESSTFGPRSRLSRIRPQVPRGVVIADQVMSAQASNELFSKAEVRRSLGFCDVAKDPEDW